MSQVARTEQGPPALDVTVAICTRNRAAKLELALGSLCSLVIPDDLQWEVIVVDNGSSDYTSAVVRRFTDRLPLRSFHEPLPGVTRARNRAVAAAAGAYICWTDDDVVVRSEWLAAYLAAFKRHPEAVLFGGPIEPLLDPPARPLFERGKDRWPLAGPFCSRSPGPTVRPFVLGNDVPYGANFAVRTAEQRQYLFDERLGPSPASRRLADELDVIYRIMKTGMTGWWVPEARVHHVIGMERQRLGYLIEYYQGIGETAAWLHERRPGDNINELNGAPLFSIRDITQLPRKLAGIGRVVVARTGLRQDRWLGFLALYGYGIGLVRHWNSRRTRRSRSWARALQAERR